MKTDDDAFVGIDEILNSLGSANVTRGLLYGLINLDSQPHRNPDRKWYISPEEWQDETYPRFANGPGYIVSNDIARTVQETSKGKTATSRLYITTTFVYLKLWNPLLQIEDVAMGIWISEMKQNGLEVIYQKDERIINDGYVVAHYQGP